MARSVATLAVLGLTVAILLMGFSGTGSAYGHSFSPFRRRSPFKSKNQRNANPNGASNSTHDASSTSSSSSSEASSVRQQPLTVTTTTASTTTTTTTTTLSSLYPSSLLSNNSALSQALQWWEDLSFPFSSSVSDESLQNLDLDDTNDSSRASVVHFCFLVHGHRGFSRDLSYLHARMRLEAKHEQARRKEAAKLQRKSRQGVVDKNNSVSTSTPFVAAKVGPHLGPAQVSLETGNSQAAMETREAQSVKSAATATLAVSEEEERQQKADPTSELATDIVDDNDDNIDDTDDFEYIRQDFVVHAAISNEKKTADGVKNGGERLYEEMLSVIRQDMWRRQQQRRRRRQNGNDAFKESAAQQQLGSEVNDISSEDESVELQDITLSVLGNSLGGLYSRYAIAKLAEHCEKVEPTTTFDNNNKGYDDHHPVYILDGKYRIHFNVFCTTATPHLGLADLTFLPIPRTAEIGMAHALGDTGRDLFRLTDLIHQMATSPKFLQPLAHFRKRVAYANTYGTDFPVPVLTAAFLSENSTYPHCFLDCINVEKEESVAPMEQDFVIASLHTPKRDYMKKKEIAMLDGQDTSSSDDDDTTSDKLLDMSNSLDALGWKKVFIDMRNNIPKIAFPKSILSRRTEEAVEADNEPIHLLRKKGTATSKEIAHAFKTGGKDTIFHVPVGHNMIVAFSRSRISSYMNKAGRPVVDFLANELVEDVFSWNDLVEI